jgi:putative peptide zinc metalloprotease protein
MNERPTFSPFWHRVRVMKPRFRPHVQITRQHYRGRRWHVVHDPTSNQFYRLNPVAHDYVCSLDGTRTVEDAWKLSLSKFGDLAPTQNEIIQLISQLYSSNLLHVDSTPETEQLLRRGRERRAKKIAAQAIGIMYFKIRLFNPDRILAWCEPIFRPILNLWGFLVWLIFVGVTAIYLAPHWQELKDGFHTLYAPQNLILIPFAYAVIKGIHEFGHGVICKRFGGQVPEFGFMLLVLFPSPYVDASATWAFPSKWRRMAVGAGGMIFELFVASICAWIWMSGNLDPTLKQLMFNAMFTASVSTVLFNANPLMRFDGYYILSDLLEVPNLQQRSQKMLQHLAQKFLYRLKNLTPPSTVGTEQAILIVYGILAGAYRIFLFVSITLFVLGQFFAIGLLLAVWTAAAWFLIPVGKFVHWNAAGPQLSEHRGRGILTSIGLVAALLILIGLIPMPDRRRGVGVVEAVARSGIFVDTDGFVAHVHKRPGELVTKGEPIVTLENEDLLQKKRGLDAQYAEFAIQYRQGLAENQPAVAQVSVERMNVVRENLAETQERIDALIVRAPHDGRIVSGDPEQRLGAFVRRGDGLCEIVDTETLRIAATMDQRQSGWLFAPADEAVAGSTPTPIWKTAEVRLVSDVDTVFEATNVRTVDSGQKLLPSAAIGYSGGGTVEIDPEDKSGRIAKRPIFTLYMDAAPASLDHPLDTLVIPGERVRVRFKLPNRPLLAQWIERLEKEIQGRVKL